ENVAGWLYLICRRKVRDHRRLAYFKHLFSRRDDAPLETLALAAPSDPSAELERKQQERRLWALLDGMSEKRRVVFVLFEIEGRSGEAIARLEAVPVNTIWTRLHHARLELMKKAAALEATERV